MNSKFNVEIYSDGRPNKYGNSFDLNIVDTIDELIYYDVINEKYSYMDLKKILTEMKVGYIMLGSQWSEFKITKVNEF